MFPIYRTRKFIACVPAACLLLVFVYSARSQSLQMQPKYDDSTVQIVCRSSLPMVVRTTSVYEVTDSAGSDEGTLLVLTRTNQVRVEGKTTSPWRIVEVAGTGDGTLEAKVAVRSGAVREVTRGDGRATLTLEGGLTVPVSRRYARALRDAGWY